MKDLKTIGLVAVGVLVAGLILSNFNTVSLIKDAQNGFDA